MPAWAGMTPTPGAGMPTRFLIPAQAGIVYQRNLSQFSGLAQNFGFSQSGTAL